MISITHTRADGTLIDGSRKGDGVYEILRGLGGNWRYFPSIGRVGIGQSRDRAAQAWKIERAAEALRAAGHEVTVEIDDTTARPFADAEAERYERAGARAERHAGLAEARQADADARWNAERAILDFIPPGQPILVGHHSERGHRRALERADAHMRAGLEAIGKRDYHEQRAETAAAYQRHRESVPVTLRRIRTLEADARRFERELAGRADYVSDGNGGHVLRLVRPGEARRVWLERERDAIAEQVTYWRGVVAEQEGAGVKVWSAADFAKGDFALFLGTWYEVLRVNGKSVTIPGMIGARGDVCRRDTCTVTWTDTVPYDKVQGRKSAAEMTASAA